jgi:hypothetical protein
VTFERNVDFPTEGKPTSAIRASPDFDTSNPVPPGPPAPGPGSSNCARYLASFLKRMSMVKELHGESYRTLSIIQDGILMFLSASFELPPYEQRTCGLILCETLALKSHE